MSSDDPQELQEEAGHVRWRRAHRASSKRLTALERIQDRGEVCLDPAEHISAPRVADTHPDDGRTALEQLADDEVLVLGDDDCAYARGVGSNLAVRGRRQPAIGDVLSGVARRFDVSCKGRRQLIVDEEAQSCAPQHGMINLRWHDLRHEYASRLVERNVPLAQVRDLLGHASITTTERYDNQKLENLHAAAARLERGETFDPGRENRSRRQSVKFLSRVRSMRTPTSTPTAYAKRVLSTKKIWT